MPWEKFKILDNAFIEINRLRLQVDRVAAVDLPGESIFSIYWDMIRKLVLVGMRSLDERDLGNAMQTLTEELPSAMNYAEKAATGKPDCKAGPTVELLEQMLAIATTALGDDRYTDMAADVRRPPAPR